MNKPNKQNNTFLKFICQDNMETLRASGERALSEFRNRDRPKTVLGLMLRAKIQLNQLASSWKDGTNSFYLDIF